MMGMDYGNMQSLQTRNTTLIVHAKRRVVLFILPRHETVSDSANETYHEQFFDDYTELQNTTVTFTTSAPPANGPSRMRAIFTLT
jgi:hypothetical protein